jgi:hypothetical protein
MRLKTLNQTKPLSLLVPYLSVDGQIARQFVDGKWMACMAQPEDLPRVGQPYSQNAAKNAAKFKELQKQGKATFSQMPFEDYWKIFDDDIRSVARDTINLEYELLQRFGLVRNRLTWEKSEIEVIVKEPQAGLDDDNPNGELFAFVDMDGLNNEKLERVNFGTNNVKVPITYKTAAIGSRNTSAETARWTIIDTNDDLVEQRNWNLLKGGGGTSTKNGRFYQGLLNNDQTLEVDNTLNGLFPAGVKFNNVADVQRIFNFVRQTFWDSRKYGGYYVMLGTSLDLELTNAVSENITNMVTLEDFVRKQRGVLDLATSFKIGKEDLVCVLADNRFVDISSSGDTPIIFELNSNMLARNIYMYTMEVVNLPGDGATGHYTVIWIKNLLSDPV